MRGAAAVRGCVAWSTAPAQDVPERSADLRLEIVARGLSDPLYLTAPAGDARLFIVEQAGRIRIVKDGRLLPTPLLDLRDSVGAGGERGLLGLAFHPAYARNGRFYVDYTDKHGDTRVKRFAVSTDPDRADPASGTQLLFIAQPYANHNGGLVMFGPDGMLYVGMGDGGSGGDPHGNGQKGGTLAGQYFFSDYCQGWLRSITYQNGRITARTLWNVPRLGQVLSFGEDGAGELYVLSDNGNVYRIAEAR